MRKMLSKIEEVDGGIKITGDVDISGKVSAKNLSGGVEYEQTVTPVFSTDAYHYDRPNATIKVSVSGNVMTVRLKGTANYNGKQTASGSLPYWALDDYAISIPNKY